MGGGSSKVMRQSEWIQARTRSDNLALIDRGVTQVFSEKGLYCGEGGEEFLKRDRIELEVYLEDVPRYVEDNLKAFIVKRPRVEPYDLRAYVAYQLARLLWLAEVVDVELEGRFLLGLRDRHTPVIQLQQENPTEKKVVQEMDIRVNIMGDKVIQRALATDPKALESIAPRCAFAEALLEADLLEAKQAKNPTIQILDGEGKRLFRKRRVHDIANCPSLNEFEAGNLPLLIKKYYEALYRSILHRRYKELLGSKPITVHSLEDERDSQPRRPTTPPPPNPIFEIPKPSPGPVIWPAESEPYDYGASPMPVQPATDTWASPASPARLIAPPVVLGGGYSDANAVEPLYAIEASGPLVEFSASRVAAPPAPIGNYWGGGHEADWQGANQGISAFQSAFARPPMYQMSLPNQYMS